MLDFSTNPPRMRITQAMWDRTPPEKRIEMDGRWFSYLTRVDPSAPRDGTPPAGERLVFEVVIVSEAEFEAERLAELPWRGHCTACGLEPAVADRVPRESECISCGGHVEWERVGPTGPRLVE